MKKWFKNNALYFIGVVVGAIAGYPDSYRDWQQVGCASGTCMITSKPINSTLYGAMMGAFLFGIFKKEKIKEIIKEGESNHEI
jgi:hypothetical protein